MPEGDHIGFAAIENDNVELMYQTYEGMKSDDSNPLAAVMEQGPSFIFMEVVDINTVTSALKGAEMVQKFSLLTRCTFESLFSQAAANYFDRTFRVRYDCLRNRAQEKPFQRTVAMRAHHNEIIAPLFRFIQNRWPR